MIASLAPVRTEVTSITAICDPAPGQALQDAGEPRIDCGSGLQLGLRAIETATVEPIERLYIEFPACDAVPCSEEQLNTASVTGWTARGSLTTRLDARLATLTVPRSDPAVAWPGASDPPAPAVAAPALDGAPEELGTRTPYPDCGTAEMGEPAAVGACFEAQVLAGHAAEARDLVPGTEGGASPVVLRFSGAGAITRYARTIDADARVGGWYAQACYLRLGSSEVYWSVEPWSDTYRELP